MAIFPNVIVTSNTHLNNDAMISKYKSNTSRLHDKSILVLYSFITTDLFDFLDQIDQWKWKATKLRDYKKMRTKLVREIRDKVGKYPSTPVTPLLQQFSTTLDEFRGTKQEDWIVLFNMLIPLYTEMMDQFEQNKLTPRNLRYSNVTRSLFHAGNALGIVFLFEWGLTPWSAKLLAGGCSILFWIGEGLKHRVDFFRRLMIFCLGPVARKHELNHVNSATWYTTALAILAFCFPNGPYSMLGVSILGLGDPMAAYIGKRYGTHRLASGKSWEGFGGFVVFGWLGGMLYMQWFYPAVSFQLALWITFNGALGGALAELFTGSFDDNFTIPIIAAIFAKSSHILLESIL